MKISHIDIQNFRKLKTCRIELADKSTIFVGENNSGKASAMDALIMFLKKSKRREISTTDITLSNWAAINKIASDWVTSTPTEPPDLSLNAWRAFLPAIDVWLSVDESQIHYVSHILPTLDWDGGLLGVRLILEPKNPETPEELYKSYIAAYSAAQHTLTARKSTKENKDAIECKSTVCASVDCTAFGGKIDLISHEVFYNSIHLNYHTST